MKKITTLLVMVFTLSLISTQAATYYVATNGNAGNPGTEAQPWSINHAFASAQAGDKVIIKNGKYDLTNQLDVQNSGNENNWIVFEGESKYGVIIDARGLSYDPNRGIIQARDKDYLRIQVFNSSKWR